MILSKQISEENKYGRKDRHDEKTNAFYSKSYRENLIYNAL